MLWIVSKEHLRHGLTPTCHPIGCHLLAIEALTRMGMASLINHLALCLSGRFLIMFPGFNTDANDGRRECECGVPASSIERIITQDFTHLLHDEHILSSPAYLHERGRPVVALWGFGLSDSPVPPHTARAVFSALRALLPNILPRHWRTPGEGNAHGDPGWKGVWLGGEGGEGMVDALSPWSVSFFFLSPLLL
ncbi:hypothetical protein B0H19DRAFT_1256867 [Mycena capillaripes]|nr:hypothetical protein B0H19DRAFT_1256867 [Mycena capillaripes]